MFSRAKKQPIIPMLVEVDSAAPLPELTSDLRAGLETLQHNPSFDYLLRRFARQAGLLETKLKFERQRDARDYEFLQSGVFWCRWLERELSTLLRHPRSQAIPASDSDLAAFDSAIEVLQ